MNATDCGSNDVFLLGRMIAGNDWVDIEHAVDRHDAAIIEEATTIAQLRRQIALIIEAFEKLDVCKLQGLENDPQGEAARDRYREILQQLKASHAVKK